MSNTQAQAVACEHDPWSDPGFLKDAIALAEQVEAGQVEAGQERARVSASELYHSRGVAMQPCRVDYFPEMLSADKADQLFNFFLEAVPWPATPATFTLYGRTCRQHYKSVQFVAEPSAAYSFPGSSTPIVIAKETPIGHALMSLMHLASEAADVRFNSVLLNRYESDGYIGPHRDKVDGLSSHTVATLSLGSVRPMIFRHIRKIISPQQFTMDPGSLLVVRPPTNEWWTHEVPRADRKRSAPTGAVGVSTRLARISLSFRALSVGK
jgi:alkylated DNA repair dioxygenase AlkB